MAFSNCYTATTTSNTYKTHCHSNLIKSNDRYFVIDASIKVKSLLLLPLVLLCVLNCNYSSSSTITVHAQELSTTNKIIFDHNELLSSEVSLLLKEGYHKTTELLSGAINRLAQRYPNLVESFIIGNSVSKNPILGLKISTAKASSPKPGVAILGGIHGDHALGHELVLHLGAFLLETYNSGNARVKNLIDSADVFLIPTLNPDGFQSAKEGDCFSSKANSGRMNKNNIDLDEDFRFHRYSDISAILASNKLQPETKAFVEWVVTGGKSVQLFATLRTGYTGISYPYDETPNQTTEHTYKIYGASRSTNAAPDKLFFEYLAHELYYQFQEEPVNSTCNPLANNITVLDGASISSTYGTLNEFLYRFANIFPINIYLDCCKYPSRDRLESSWKLHANSLFALLESIKIGIRGTVIDKTNSKPIQNVRISMKEIPRNVTTDSLGRYWRPLPPGYLFNLTVDAYGYRPAIRSLINSSALDLATGLAVSNKLNFKLIPANQPAGEVYEENNSPKTENQHVSPGSGKLLPSIKYKPDILFDDVDNQIMKLDFKTPTDLDKHHNYAEVVSTIHNLSKNFPRISRLYSIGKSVEDRDLWVMEISNQPGDHQLLKPEFRYIANLHGNEVVGRELLLNMAKLMLENYGYNEFITSLVNSTRIHFLFSINPDGYEQSSEGDCESEIGRPNSNSIDLNRNFPDRFGQTKENRIRQPEVAAVMNWSHQYPFVLGANLHGGSVVANYPFDGNKQKESGLYEAAPDDKMFIHLALTYSTNHPTMSKGEHCYDICGEDRTSLLNERFKDGITNGAKWYILYGGIQDWVYLNTDCLSITVELGCMKYPHAKDLPKYWADNKKPLFKYMLEIHHGIYGIVTDQDGQVLPNAIIHVKNIDHDIHSAKTGDYWRLLIPGEHLISVSKEGYRTAHRTVIVDKYGSPAKRVDFSLNSGSKDLSHNEIGVINELDHSNDQPSANFAAKSDKHNEQPEPVAAIAASSSPSPANSALNSTTEIQGNQLSDSSHALGNSQSLTATTQDSNYIIAICFIIVLPSIMLLLYLFISADSKKPNKLGFYRLATTAPEDVDDNDDDHEGTKFMKRSTKFNQANQASDSEDELYSADSWTK